MLQPILSFSSNSNSSFFFHNSKSKPFYSWNEGTAYCLHPSTNKQDFYTCTSYHSSCSHCLELKKMNWTRTGRGGLGKWSNRVHHCFLQIGPCFPLMLSCFSSLSKTKLINWCHVKMAMKFSDFQVQNSPLILHHFQKFNLPNDPCYVLFELVMLIFKIIKQWRISNLRVKLPLFHYLLLLRSRFTSFPLFLFFKFLPHSFLNCTLTPNFLSFLLFLLH